MLSRIDILLLPALLFLLGHSIYLILILILKRDNPGNQLLAMILIALLVRVGKSILSVRFPETAFIASLIGLVSMATIGPFLMLYVRHLFQFEKPATFKLSIHFMPALISIFMWRWAFLNFGYFFIAIQLLLYLIGTAVKLFRNKEIYHADDIRWKWAVAIVTSISILWITFCIQLFAYDKLIYLANVTLASLIFYGLSLWASFQAKLFTSPSKTRVEVEVEQYNQIGLQIKKLINEEIYIDPLLNLTLLSKKLNSPPYVVSRAINFYFKMSFPELLLNHRIQKAEELLSSSFNKTYTIEGIAYESGFSTLSAFYSGFKKIKGMTPAQFRKSVEIKKMRIA